MTIHNPEQTPHKQLLIAISSCLLGKPVRYDGGHKQHPLIKDLIYPNVETLEICPEAAIGLGIPRATIQLIFEDKPQEHGSAKEHLDKQLIAWQAKNRTNLAPLLRKYAEHIVHTQANLCGYIFKARSPSCGVGSAPFYNHSGQLLGFTSGIFAGHLQELLGMEFPVCEESAIVDEGSAESFLKRVHQYACDHNIG